MQQENIANSQHVTRIRLFRLHKSKGNQMKFCIGTPYSNRTYANNMAVPLRINGSQASCLRGNRHSCMYIYFQFQWVYSNSSHYSRDIFFPYAVGIQACARIFRISDLPT